MNSGHIIFSNSADNHVYHLDVDSLEVNCIIDKPDCRYADFFPDPINNSLIYSIEEDHQDSKNIANCLVVIDLSQYTTEKLTQGADFYTSPRISPCGEIIVWIQWNHPEMPWTGAQLFMSRLNRRLPFSPKLLAGSSLKSVSEPRWGSNGELYFLQEISDYRSIYSCNPKKEDLGILEVGSIDGAEFGGAEFFLGR